MPLTQCPEWELSEQGDYTADGMQPKENAAGIRLFLHHLGFDIEKLGAAADELDLQHRKALPLLANHCEPGRVMSIPWSHRRITVRAYRRFRRASGEQRPEAEASNSVWSIFVVLCPLSLWLVLQKSAVARNRCLVISSGSVITLDACLSRGSDK